MDFLKELLAAVGGAVGIVLLLLAFAKGVIQNWLETIIDNASKKSLAKYSNVLNRRTTAYEMLLEKEFTFYENTSIILSELIVDIMDYTFDLGISDDHPDLHDYEKAKASVLRILRSIPKFKRETLLAHTYLPEAIDAASTQLIHDLQESSPLIYNGLKLALDGNLDNNTINAIKKNEDVTLMNCALVNHRIKTRLAELSKE